MGNTNVFCAFSHRSFYGHFTKKQTYTFMDTIASLSSGISMVIKDALGLALVLVSYPFILKNIGIWEQESTIALLFITAFICIDFAQYWIHRLAHKINLFGINTMIHHSSEEFNLACALRQSISNIDSLYCSFFDSRSITRDPFR